MMDKNPHLDGSADEFIEQNLGLARKVAWSWIPYVQRNENIKFDKDDLVSIAYIGLINAYQKFDPTKFDGDIQFSTYAYPMISGEIRRWIRDKGNTIRKSRDGEIFFTDSLDAPIGEDGNLTVGDTVRAESYEIENQVIIKDFLSQIEPRLQRLYKLWSADLNQREIGKSMGISQVQISRLQKQLLELAGQYGEGGISMANDGTKKMREEITTLEQFNSIGSGGVVARKYGVSAPTAYGLKRQLTEKEGEAKVGVIKEGDVKMETTPFEIANIPANHEAIEKLVEGTQCTIETLKDNRVGECANINNQEPENVNIKSEAIEKWNCFGMYENKNVPCVTNWCNKADECHEASFISAYVAETDQAKETLSDLSEPEPPWTPKYAEGPMQTTGDIKIVQILNPEWDELQETKAPDQIERSWINIKTELVLIRMLYKERAVEEFKERLAKMLEVS